MKQLPKKPSELLRVALADLEAVENMPGYVIDMGTWHSPQSDGCHVCHAGAVMANSLNVEKSFYAYPFSRIPDGPDKNALNAINDFRIGAIGVGLFTLGITRPVSLLGWHREEVGVPALVSAYHPDHREDYKNYIAGLIGIFEAEGL